VIKATYFEVTSTLRDVLKTSSLWRDHVQTYTQVDPDVLFFIFILVYFIYFFLFTLHPSSCQSNCRFFCYPSTFHGHPFCQPQTMGLLHTQRIHSLSRFLGVSFENANTSNLFLVPSSFQTKLRRYFNFGLGIHDHRFNNFLPMLASTKLVEFATFNQ